MGRGRPSLAELLARALLGWTVSLDGSVPLDWLSVERMLPLSVQLDGALPSSTQLSAERSRRASASRLPGRSSSGAVAHTLRYARAASTGVAKTPILRRAPPRITFATHFLPCLKTPI